MEDVLRRVARLERTIKRLEAREYPVIVSLAAPLTSVDWDGDAKTVADNAIINLSTAFGAPTNIKGAFATLAIQDGTINIVGRLGRDAVNISSVVSRIQTADQYDTNSGFVPCDTNGDFYFSCSGDLDHVDIKIWAYVI